MSKNYLLLGNEVPLTGNVIFYAPTMEEWAVKEDYILQNTGIFYFLHDNYIEKRDEYSFEDFCFLIYQSDREIFESLNAASLSFTKNPLTIEPISRDIFLGEAEFTFDILKKIVEILDLFTGTSSKSRKGEDLSHLSPFHRRLKEKELLKKAKDREKKGMSYSESLIGIMVGTGISLEVLKKMNLYAFFTVQNFYFSKEGYETNLQVALAGGEVKDNKHWYSKIT